MTLLKISNLIHSSQGTKEVKKRPNECEWVEFLAYQCQCLWGHHDLRLTLPFVTCPLWIISLDCDTGPVRSDHNLTFFSAFHFSHGAGRSGCVVSERRMILNLKWWRIIIKWYDWGEKVFTIIFRSLSVKTENGTDWKMLVLHPQHLAD